MTNNITTMKLNIGKNNTKKKKRQHGSILATEEETNTRRRRPMMIMSEEFSATLPSPSTTAIVEDKDDNKMGRGLDDDSINDVDDESSDGGKNDDDDDFEMPKEAEDDDEECLVTKDRRPAQQTTRIGSILTNDMPQYQQNSTNIRNIASTNRPLTVMDPAPPPGQKKKPSTTRSKAVNNDNFVRQNLKNSAGACRGARNKKLFKGGRRFGRNNDNNEEWKKSRSENKKYTTSQTSASYSSRMTGMDPLDEYLDGEFDGVSDDTKQQPQGNQTKKKVKRASKTQDDGTPICARHQRPCKLITVKKNTSGNKGRKFYACSMPRGEQCDHFQWAEDTIEVSFSASHCLLLYFRSNPFAFLSFPVLTLLALNTSFLNRQVARATVSKNSSHSNFIARQVTAHINRFRPLTVPELREKLIKRKLDKNGKKQQLLMRLAIWTRDEIAKTCVEEKNDISKYSKQTEESETATSTTNDLTQKTSSVDMDDALMEDSDENESDNIDEDSVSSEELEIFSNKDDDSDSEEEVAIDDSDDDTENVESNKSARFDNAEPGTPLAVLQTVFGHSGFRDGQEWAIERCLEKKKSILVAPTGFGKSLCYALPAAMMDGVCVVVSPLISLIEVWNIDTLALRDFAIALTFLTFYFF